MDEIGPDGLLRHSVRTHMLMRVFLIASGAFVLCASAIELCRGIWPLNLLSLPFILILLGAFSVGISMMVVGLVGPSLDWTVGPGRIEIRMTNPFGRRTRIVTPIDVAQFYISENDGDGGPSAFRVIMKTTDGKRYETRQVSTRCTAQALEGQVKAIFYGLPA